MDRGRTGVGKRRTVADRAELGRRAFEREAASLEEWVQTLEDLAELKAEEIEALLRAVERTRVDDPDA